MIKVAVSGYYDIPHVGHIESFKLAKELGDYLIVFVDGDNRAIAKKGYVFMPEQERAEIIRNLSCVDEVIIVHDSIDKALEKYKPNIFAKGGDRTLDNLPQSEIDVCKKYNIEIVCGLGEKIQSSSWLINNYKNNVFYTEFRPWGSFQVIESQDRYKVKKLIINPQKSLSSQSHNHRNEHWYILNGKANVQIDNVEMELTTGQSCNIPIQTQHRISNFSDNVLEIIEIQTGDYLGEDDIIRLEDRYGRA